MSDEQAYRTLIAALSWLKHLHNHAAAAQLTVQQVEGLERDHDALHGVILAMIGEEMDERRAAREEALR